MRDVHCTTATTSRSGYSLMEVMVVAILVAILATLAVPAMNGNRRRAWATEAQTGCGTVRTAMRIILLAHGEYPALSDAPVYPNIEGISQHDLDGAFFLTTDYRITSTPSNFVITCTGTSPRVAGRTVILTSEGNWGGTLLQ